jgi:alkaline phosphatase D
VLRRDFLKLSGAFLAAAGFPGLLTACSSNGKSSVHSETFPQGVASGDPRPNSVVMWTRALPDLFGQPHSVTAEVSLDEAFTNLVLQETFQLSAASDYTLRVIVENLEPDTFYFYRFVTTSGKVSAVGRTLTAPPLSDPTEIHFAFVSCQDRGHGFYNAYRRMINDDRNQPKEKQIRFVLHLGDFIYETSNDPLTTPLDDAFNPIEGGLIDGDGNRRGGGPFPDGGKTSNGIFYARTLDDYRHLYREYLTDPDLQEARARWPFIHLWDDHEFSDDSWQTEANYESAGSKSSTDEPSQPRKVAANQAWFEYLPVNLLQRGEIDPDLQQTKAFEFAEVGETPNDRVDDFNFAENEDNRKAIDTLTIYRSFRFGRWLELVVTDDRSYRSDHAVPEEISGNRSVFVDPRMLLPLELVNQLDAGRTANNGNPDSFIFAGGVQINPRFNRPPGTILGAKQKEWWKDRMLRSEARWKIWGNPVPLMRFLVNLSALNTGLPDVVLSTDSWDGYASERNELMNFLASNRVENVLSLSGDFHAHFAGIVMNNYDAKPPETPSPVMVEFVCGSISSVSMFAAARGLSARENPTENEQLLQSLISYDATQADEPGEDRVVNNLNNTLLNGVMAGIVAAQTNSLPAIEAAKNPNVNRHLKYADTDGHGFGWVSVAENEVKVKLITLSSITQETDDADPGIQRTANFIVPSATVAGRVELSDPMIEGSPPFP